MIEGDKHIRATPLHPKICGKLDGIDHQGNLLTTAVVTEKPLTVFLNGQEIIGTQDQVIESPYEIWFLIS